MCELPRITVITPSFNQAEFLERTILSVIEQGYPNLEFIIVDGGSTDGSVEIIKQYSNHLAWWVSEPDRGQTHAINKGLYRATGDWVAWQNSDDVYMPTTFSQLARTVEKFPQAELIIGDMCLIDAHNRLIRELRYVTPTYASLIAEGMVLANQSAFWKRSIHKRIGWLDETRHYCFDYEWFLRILENTNNVKHVPQFWGALRYHDTSKTSTSNEKFDREFREILDGRVMRTWQKRFFQIRRFVLTLGYGHFRYLARGLVRRARGNR